MTFRPSWRLATALLLLVTVALPGSAREPLGQSSRRTSLVISEIMYRPSEVRLGSRTAELEFVELYNSRSEPEDLGGFRLSGDVDFVFPSGTVLPGLGYLVVARSPADLAAVCGVGNALGPWSGAETNGLPNDGGTVRLRHRSGALLLEVAYSDRAPWPVAADGGGHSLVLAQPSYGERDPRAWSASDTLLGSPGRAEPASVEPLASVRINEFLAHTDWPDLDFVELYNHGAGAADLSGCILTDDARTNKFVIKNGTVLGPGEWLSFTEDTLGFSLDAAGEKLYLINAGRTRVLDAVRFEGQENGVATGRYPDGSDQFYQLASRTPGLKNGFIRPSPVVINEIMYHPISGDDGDQYLELYNWSGAAVDLSGWSLADGVEFVFPPGSVLGAGGYLVVGRNAARLLARYPNLGLQNCLGNFTGRLSHQGERVALCKPDTLVSTNASGVAVTNTIQIVVNEVTYREGGRWPRWADGGGSSLELTDARANGRLASNWADSDETGKAPWTLIERRGVIDNGNVSANSLQVLLAGAGECLVDEVEVLDAGGQNRVTNPGFEGDASGWVAEGTQSQSSWEQSEGYASSRSFRVRAVARGDNQLNRLRTSLSSALTSGTTATLRARVRWLRGHPEIILRLRGNWLEAAGRMDLPTTLGTPGAVNSRANPNAGPCIENVAHAPVLPAANQAVVISAEVQDPDAAGAVVLYYRLDPGTSYTAAAMADDGNGGDRVAGDGVFSAIVPGQAAGAQIAFYIEAQDGSAAGVVSRFPADAPGSEGVVRFGETSPAGDFPVYRLWMTQNAFNTWSGRKKLDNTPNPITFVAGAHRVIYNAEAQFAGSPYISGSFNTPSGNRCGYSIGLPADDPFLGGTDLVLDWPGGHGGERTAVQEQMAYWIADKMGLPFSHRHYIRLFVHGVSDMQRGGVFEAILQPGGDFLDQWSSGDTDGQFYKIDRAFEFRDDGTLSADPMPRLQVYTTPDLVKGGTQKKVERYRWTWLKRSYDTILDYTNVLALVDALNAAGPEPYTSATAALVDVPEFMGMFAFEHIINNFDSWGHNIGKNMYCYKPANGLWQIYAFDLDWLMLVSVRASTNYSALNGPLFASDDPTVTRMYNHPPFRRAYFQAVLDAVNGPLAAANCDPVMDAKYASLLANGITKCDGGALVGPAEVKTWFRDRRMALMGHLANVAAPFAVAGPAEFTVSSSPATISGTAPIALAALKVNGIVWPVTWTTVTNWTLQFPLVPGTNALSFAGFDRHGSAVPQATAAIKVILTGTPAGRVLINEWMADNARTLPDPVDGGFNDWFELYNPGPGAVDLGGRFLSDSLANKFLFEIPKDGRFNLPPQGFLLVWADEEPWQNTNGLAGLHVNFKLSKEGDAIGLFNPDGSIVDYVTFGPLQTDLSGGRYPDGSGTVTLLPVSSPGTRNLGPALSFTQQAGELVLGCPSIPRKRYRVLWKAALQDAAWQFTGLEQAGTGQPLSFRTGTGPGGFYRIEALDW